ncbi:MAG: GNAT family N-acetyltransferase [Woeseiaceae bacterium]
MPDGAVIRVADAADAELLATVGSSTFRDAYGEHSKPADLETHLANNFSLRAVQKEIAGGQCTYLLAMLNDMPCGMAKYRNAACPVPGGDDNAIEVQQLYVLDASQGHGIGRKLMERVSDDGRQRGVAGIWLSAWELADWATGFYVRAGFTDIGKVQFKVGETSYTDLLMWRPLAESAG